MPRTLTFARKLLSLKNRVLVTDASDKQIYEATWSIAFPTRTWEISNASGVVASFRRRLFALRPTWDVQSTSGSFTLRKPWFSLVRRIQVIGGAFNGAEMVSGPFRMNYKIELGAHQIARADTKILSIRERHDVELVDETPSAESLTIVLVVNLMIDEFARHEAAKVEARDE